MPAKRSRSGRGGSARPVRQVLIVDDEESLAFFMKQGLLETHPEWQIDTANTGEQAVIQINRYAYGLIISDLRMPGLTGLELQQMIRALEPKTKVILMTAFGSDQIAEEARRLQVFRYMTKPFPMEELQAWANEALGYAQDHGPVPAEIAPPAPDEVQSPPPGPERAPGAAATERVASSRSDGPALSRLAQLRFRTGARVAFLGDADGQVLAHAGSPPEPGALSLDDVGALASVIASCLRETWPSGTALGELVEPAVLLQRSAGYAVGAATVGAGRFVAVIHAGAPPRAESILAQLREAAQDVAALWPDAAWAGAPDSPAEAAEGDAAASEPPAPAEADVAPAEEDWGWADDGEGAGGPLPGGDTLSWEQAQAMGLVGPELLSRFQEDEEGSAA